MKKRVIDRQINKFGRISDPLKVLDKNIDWDRSMPQRHVTLRLRSQGDT